MSPFIFSAWKPLHSNFAVWQTVATIYLFLIGPIFLIGENLIQWFAWPFVMSTLQMGLVFILAFEIRHLKPLALAILARETWHQFLGGPARVFSNNSMASTRSSSLLSMPASLYNISFPDFLLTFISRILVEASCTSPKINFLGSSSCGWAEFLLFV